MTEIARCMATAVFLVAAIVLVDGGAAQAQDDSTRVLPTDVFPVKKGAKWTYTAGDAEVTITVEGTETVGDQECAVLTWEGTSGSVRQFYAITERGVFLYRLASNKTIEYKDNPIPRLKFGTKKGDSWESTTKGMEGTYENQGEEEIEVPAGKYKAWKIVGKTKFEGRDYRVSRWFVPNVGLVKEERAPGEQAKALVLKKYEEGK